MIPRKGWFGPASSFLMHCGLFTLSWDRFAAIEAGSFNVKLPIMLFFFSLLLTVLDLWSAGTLPGRKQNLVPALWLTFAIFIVMGLLAVAPDVSMLQAVTVLLGAIVPFLAVYLNIRLFGEIDRALTFFIRGGYVAAAFGLYQLAAFYLNLPQFIEYRAMAGGFGRISSFNYESGYFSYFIVLVIAVVVARQRLRNRPVGYLSFAFFAVVLILANSRATLIMAPLLLLFLFFVQPKTQKRFRLWPFAAVAVLAATLFIAVFPDRVARTVQRAASIFDPHEAASNSPRLEMIARAWTLAQDHFLTGIGAGNFYTYLKESAPQIAAGQSSNSLVVNDAWLQALLDGGVFLLAAQVVVAILALALYRKRNPPVVRALMAGWIAVFIVSSIGNSYFWDLKLWAVLGLVLGIVSLHQAGRLPVTTGDNSVERV